MEKVIPSMLMRRHIELVDGINKRHARGPEETKKERSR